jgi:hypothetical protein
VIEIVTLAERAGATETHVEQSPKISPQDYLLLDAQFPEGTSLRWPSSARRSSNASCSAAESAEHQGTIITNRFLIFISLSSQMVLRLGRRLGMRKFESAEGSKSA